MTYVLDTSGRVDCVDDARFDVGFDDLSPFTQGYIEALFADLNGRRIRATNDGLDPYGFSDLAPETLARIIADCERYLAPFGPRAELLSDKSGRMFWEGRQADSYNAFPPLTVRLGDDGKVRVAEPKAVSQ